MLYDGFEHRLGPLALDVGAVIFTNAQDVSAVLGQAHGWTIRLIADVDKANAAYENAWSLILRDAGCLVMTVCLVAEWLGLRACPLGLMGHSLSRALGFPGKRFKGVGAVQVCSSANAAATKL